MRSFACNLVENYERKHRPVNEDLEESELSPSAKYRQQTMKIVLRKNFQERLNE